MLILSNSRVTCERKQGYYPRCDFYMNAVQNKSNIIIEQKFCLFDIFNESDNYKYKFIFLCLFSAIHTMILQGTI